MSQHAQSVPALRNSGDDFRLQAAREILWEADRYIEAGDAVRAMQLLQEAERIVIELAKERALTLGKKPD